MNFSEKTPVTIEYRNKRYNSEVQYNNNVLYMTVFTDEGDAFLFYVDNTDCSIEFEGLSQEFSLTSLEKDFLPVAVYDFFVQLGADFKTELYEESSGIGSISRDFRGVTVTLEVLPKENVVEYIIKIN